MSKRSDGTTVPAASDDCSENSLFLNIGNKTASGETVNGAPNLFPKSRRVNSAEKKKK